MPSRLFQPRAQTTDTSGGIKFEGGAKLYRRSLGDALRPKAGGGKFVGVSKQTIKKKATTKRTSVKKTTTKRTKVKRTTTKKTTSKKK